MTKRNPRGIVDFKNGVTTDTRWQNLIHTNNSGKIRYGKVRANNNGGISGVSYLAAQQKWRARAVINGREMHIGLYATRHEAAAARLRIVPNLRRKQWSETLG